MTQGHTGLGRSLQGHAAFVLIQARTRRTGLPTRNAELNTHTGVLYPTQDADVNTPSGGADLDMATHSAGSQTAFSEV